MSDASVAHREFERKRLIAQDSLAAEKMRRKEEAEIQKKEEQKYVIKFLQVSVYSFSDLYNNVLCPEGKKRRRRRMQKIHDEEKGRKRENAKL